MISKDGRGQYRFGALNVKPVVVTLKGSNLLSHLKILSLKNLVRIPRIRFVFETTYQSGDTGARDVGV